MTFFKKTVTALSALVISAGFLAASVSQSHAGLVMTLEADDGAGGTASQTITDLSGFPRQVSFNGSLGVYFLNITFSVALEGAQSSSLTSVSFNATSSAGGDLAITVEEDAYSMPVGLASVFSRITPTAGPDIDFKSEVDGTTVLDATGLQGGDVAEAGIMTTLSDPFSIKHTFSISHAGSEVTTFDAHTTASVPEPATLGLIGASLVGLGAAATRRRRATAA